MIKKKVMSYNSLMNSKPTSPPMQWLQTEIPNIFNMSLLWRTQCRLECSVVTLESSLITSVTNLECLLEKLPLSHVQCDQNVQKEQVCGQFELRIIDISTRATNMFAFWYRKHIRNYFMDFACKHSAISGNQHLLQPSHF